MCACREAVKKVVYHAENVSQGKHGNDVVTGTHRQHFVTIGYVGPQTAVRQHYAFGIAGGAGSVIDDRQFFRRLFLAIADMFGTEVFGIACAIDSITVFECFHEPFVPANDRSEIRQQYHSH